MPWLSLRRAEEQRLLIGIYGGLLVVNVSAPRSPQAQAFFQWPQGDAVFDAREILLAAGRQGIHQLGINESNLSGVVSPAPDRIKRKPGVIGKEKLKLAAAKKAARTAKKQ